MAPSTLAIRPRDHARLISVVLFSLTVGQLLVATLAPGLPQFEGKAFGARLVFYPLLMAVVPVGCWARWGPCVPAWSSRAGRPCG